MRCACSPRCRCDAPMTSLWCSATSQASRAFHSMADSRSLNARWIPHCAATGTMGAISMHCWNMHAASKTTKPLIVLATDEHAMAERHIIQFRRIARTHPVVLIDVATLNPFLPVSHGHRAPLDGTTGRRVPAFLRSRKSANEVSTHRKYMAAALEQELTRAGSHMIRATSSEAMFDRFVTLVSPRTGKDHAQPAWFRPRPDVGR